MALVTLKDIELSYGGDGLFKAMGLRIHRGEKIGLVGPNGCGKTTLLNIIIGAIEPDIGQVRLRKKLRIGHLPQEPDFAGDKTVLEELHSGAEEVLGLQRKIQEAADKVSKLSGSQLNAAMRQYDHLTHEFEQAGGYEYEARIKEIAAGIGISEEHYALHTHQLSGGQLSRLGLAKVLLAGSELLLLDEPTNHLDWEALAWLERFLNNYKGAALIVSHDRFLLDRLATGIVEIGGKKANLFSGNYSNYRREKEKRDLELSRQYQARVEWLERTRDFIARNKDQEGMRKVARGRKKYLERILDENPDFLDKPGHEKEVQFEFAPVESKGKRTGVILSCRNLTKRFDDVTLFENLNLELYSRQRLGVVGPNGTGKTTLLKLALGRDEPSSGTIELDKNLQIGYLDQAGAELKDLNTVLDEITRAAPQASRQQLRSTLGAFLFSGDDVFKKVEDLSGGERNRLALCKLVVGEAQMLVLDEPTNHLDIASTEAFENALLSYTGTVVVVSHDRFFLDKVTDRLLVVGADESGRKAMGKCELVIGSYSRYAELLDQRTTAREKNAKAAGARPKRPKPAKKKKTTPPELRQFNVWTVEKIEDAIISTEQKIAALQEQFGDEKIYKDHTLLAELHKKFDDKKAYLDLLYRAYELKSK